VAALPALCWDKASKRQGDSRMDVRAAVATAAGKPLEV